MDIVSLPIELNKKKHTKVENEFRLVAIAIQRAKELSLGAKQKIETKAKKLTTAALIEAISGEIDFLTGEDAVAARHKAEKFEYKKITGEKKRPTEDLSELEKDLKVYLHEKESAEKAFEELFVETKKDKK